MNLSLRHFIPDWNILREVIIIDFPSFLQLSGYSISILIVNVFLKKYGGDLSISTYGIVSKINTLLLVPVTGLAQGIQPIIGYNHGAGKKGRVRETVGRESCIAAGYGTAAYLFVLLCARVMLRVFTPEAAVIEMGSEILKIINISLLFNSLQYIQSTYFQAVGKRLISVLLALSNQVICFIPPSKNYWFFVSRISSVSRPGII